MSTAHQNHSNFIQAVVYLKTLEPDCGPALLIEVELGTNQHSNNYLIALTILILYEIFFKIGMKVSLFLSSEHIILMKVLWIMKKLVTKLFFLLLLFP